MNSGLLSCSNRFQLVQRMRSTPALRLPGSPVAVNLATSKAATRRWQSGSCWELELQVGVVIVCAPWVTRSCWLSQCSVSMQNSLINHQIWWYLLFLDKPMNLHIIHIYNLTIYIYIYTYIHTYVYILIHIHMYISQSQWNWTLSKPNSTQPTSNQLPVTWKAYRDRFFLQFRQHLHSTLSLHHFSAAVPLSPKRSWWESSVLYVVCIFLYN